MSVILTPDYLSETSIFASPYSLSVATPVEVLSSTSPFGILTTPRSVVQEISDAIRERSPLPVSKVISASPYFPLHSPLYSPLHGPTISPLSPLSLFPGSPIPTSITSPMIPGLSIVDSPVVASLNLSYSKPLFSIHKNYERNPRLHRRMAKHYYYKTYEKWLGNEMSDLLGYLIISGGKAKLVSSISKYNKKKDSHADMKKKIDYIKNNIMDEIWMLRTLHKFVRETGSAGSWFDLPKNEYFIRRYVQRKLKKKIENTINK